MNNLPVTKYLCTTIKPCLTPLYLSLFLHTILTTYLHVAGDSPSIYTPVEDITVNCGTSGNIFNAYDNRNWSGDINSKFSPFENQTVYYRSVVKDAPHSYTVQQVPYTTARLSHFEFTYRFFNLTAGQKFIRFYFYPASYPDFDPSKALFSVKARGFTLLHDFNASVTAAASGPDETVYREFCMNIDEEEEEQSLNITFSPSIAITDAYAFINGIEIVSMPTNLYYTDGIQFVGRENNVGIENSTALETVYRINVGGSALFFEKDTGMYRNWYDYTYEQRYLDELSLEYSVFPQNASIQLHFTTKPEYSAPKEVYQTARAMGNNTAINKSYNLTWQFPVDSNFHYLVRLHFCEFQPEIMDMGYQVFLIYMNNLAAEQRADIIMWAKGNGIPTYRDYLVFIQPTGSAGSKKKVNLAIALQAKPNDFSTIISDAMLNGLEIFKISDSQSNLAGPNPDPPADDPVDDITVHVTVQCGYYGQRVNQDDGRNWTGDINSTFSPFEVHQSSSSYTSLEREASPSSSSSFASRVPTVPYNRSRLSRSEFAYRFPFTTGQKFIRLYFYPASYGADFDRSNALFSVKAGGFTLLNQRRMHVGTRGV